MTCTYPSCSNESWSRALCGKHYQYLRRHGELMEWPSEKFLEAPEQHIEWAFGSHPELIADVAIQFGYRLVKDE